MNLDHLTKLYDQLTPRERLPLIIAAGVRGDKAEQERLSASAPKEKYQAPNYYRLSRALKEAVYVHRLTLLDLAALFWRGWGLWNAFGLPNPEDAPRRKRHRRKAEAEGSLGWWAHGICRYYAARFVAHVEGWKRFCSELHIDPEVPLHFMIGWETILQTEKQARALALAPRRQRSLCGSSRLPRDEGLSPWKRRKTWPKTGTCAWTNSCKASEVRNLIPPGWRPGAAGHATAVVGSPSPGSRQSATGDRGGSTPGRAGQPARTATPPGYPAPAAGGS